MSISFKITMKCKFFEMQTHGHDWDVVESRISGPVVTEIKYIYRIQQIKY